MGTIGRIGVVVGLALIVAVLGAAVVEAKGPKTGEVPFLLFRTGQCIDFDDDYLCSICIDFNRDNDCDGDTYPDWVEQIVGSDPNNTQSAPEFSLLDEQARWHDACHDGVDNDLDGRADARDEGCHVTCHDYATGLTCIDRDADGWLAYTEMQLGSDPNDGSSQPESVFVPGSCADGIDNDLDGKTDSGPADTADDGCDVIADCVDFTGDPLCLPF